MLIEGAGKHTSFMSCAEITVKCPNCGAGVDAFVIKPEGAAENFCANCEMFISFNYDIHVEDIVAEDISDLEEDDE